MEEGKQIILFDGVCNLCNGVVQLVIKKDTKDVFRFASLQSDIGQQLIKERHIDTAKVDSIILIQPGIAYYTKSSAALEIARHLGPFYRMFVVFKGLPRGIRDIVYDFTARNRYRWFGKKEQCMVPTPELRAKFLDDSQHQIVESTT
ncbi:MAG: thiol-disulfide oxidoreductase DCC family protein [Flavobacteriaceae bacterium]